MLLGFQISLQRLDDYPTTTTQIQQGKDCMKSTFIIRSMSNS